MDNLNGACIVSITDFNRGKSSQIFRELKEKNEIIVMKNNRPIARIQNIECNVKGK